MSIGSPKLLAAAAAALAGLAAPAAARAEGFVAASALRAEWPVTTCVPVVDCERHGNGWMARAGWMFTPWIGVEARTFDLGESRNASTTVAGLDGLAFELGGQRSDAKGTGIGVVLAWPVSHDVTLSAVAGFARTRARVVRVDTAASCAGCEGGVLQSIQYVEGRGNEPYYAIGMDYYLMPALALSAEVQRTNLRLPGNVEAVDSVSLGITVRWR